MISESISQNTNSTGSLSYGLHEWGYFVLFNDTGDAYLIFKCRDQFHGILPIGTNVIGFAHDNVSIENLNSLFNEIDQRLGLKDSVVLHKSNINRLIVIEISDFWSKNFVRMNLLSLFVRCGAIYYKGNINDSIDNYPLAKLVKYQIEFFLDGNIFPMIDKWNKNSNGFVTEFKDLNKEQLAAKLSCLQVKPADFFKLSA